MAFSREQKKAQPRLIYSLRLRLMLMSFIIILLTMLPTAWLVDNLLQKHLAHDVTRQLQSDVAVASLYYQGWVDRVGAAAITAANDTTIKTTLRLEILGQLQKHLDKLTRQMHLDFLAIVDPEGNILLPGFPHVVTRSDLEDHPLLKGAAGLHPGAGTMLEENASLLYLLEKQGRAIDFRPVVVIEAAAPITLRDTRLGSILAGVMVSGNRELMQGMEQAAQGGRVAVVAAGRLAADSRTGETDRKTPVRFPARLDYRQPLVPGIENTVEFPSRGPEMVYAYRGLKIRGRAPETALVVMRPLETMLTVITRFRNLVLWIFGSSLLLSLVAAVFMSRSIARPLHAITRSMRDIRRGRKVEPIRTSREDEIGDMIRGFNDMALSLEKRIRDLGAEIKNREQAEERLAAESERLRVTLQSMEDAVLAVDIDNRIVLMNRIAEELTGWSRKKALGRRLAEVFSPVDPGQGNRPVDPLEWLRRRPEIPGTIGADLLLEGGGGIKRQVTLSGSRLIDRRGRVIGAVLVVRDVTAQRRMEEELAKTQKLESVGVLAGGIAHDFNNLLTAILGNLSLAVMVSKPDDAHYRNIRDAEKASLRARELTQQLLTFSRGGSPVKDTVDLEQLVRESAEFVAHGAAVRLRFFCEQDIWPVLVDRGQTGQVIDNLVINAIQASPDGGYVDIRIKNVTLGPDSPLPLAGSRYVRITVQDYGTGISREHLDKVFDPYFTTKELGSGLGLSICFSIVKKHGGCITAESSPGRGSVFQVYLPAVDSVDSTLDSVDETARYSGPDGLRLLLLDDETMVRSVATQMVEKLGHTVVAVAEGSEAVELYRRAMEEGQPFDAVILDLTVPGGMGGEEVARRLWELDPGVRAIVASGYSDHPVMAEPGKFHFAGVIVKPFRLGDLARVLEKVMAA